MPELTTGIHLSLTELTPSTPASVSADERPKKLAVSFLKVVVYNVLEASSFALEISPEGIARILNEYVEFASRPITVNRSNPPKTFGVDLLLSLIGIDELLT